MALHPEEERRKREAILEYLDQEQDPRNLARFLSQNRRKMSRFVQLQTPFWAMIAGFFGNKTYVNNFDRLVNYLNSGEDEKIDKARNRLNQSLQANGSIIPVEGLELSKLPIKKAFIDIEKQHSSIVARVAGIAGLDRRDWRHIKIGFLTPTLGYAFSATAAGPLLGAIMGATVLTTPDNAEAAIPVDNNPITTTEKENRVPDISSPSSLDGSQITRFLVDQFDQRSSSLQNETGLSSPYLYNPFLVKKLKTDPEAREIVTKLTHAAQRYGLDPVLFVNQMYRESASFDPDVIYGPETSSEGALGISQIIPSTGKNYGLLETEDFFDIDKSINAGAEIMRDLTEKYGDQIVAMAAYNGGDGAVLYPMRELGLNKITADQIKAFYEEMREIHGVGDIKKWRNQTYKYMRIIDGTGWEPAHTRWAQQQQRNGLPEHMAFISKIIPGFSIGTDENPTTITMTHQSRRSPS